MWVNETLRATLSFGTFGRVHVTVYLYKRLHSSKTVLLLGYIPPFFWHGMAFLAWRAGAFVG